MNTKRIADKIRNGSDIHKGNRIILVHNDNTEELVETLKNITIKYYGENSLVKIHEGYNIAHLNLFVGEGAYLELGKNLTIRFSFTIDAKAENTTISIGENACIGTGNIFAGDEEGLEVIIGKNFLSATDLYIRNSDGHTIYDLETKLPVNKPTFGIHIGNNVWCGYNVSIIKDANIPNNCVIGAGSVVGKREYCENSIIAGAPAKTVRKGIMWDPCTVTKYLGTNEKQYAADNSSKEYFRDNFFVISSEDNMESIAYRLYGYVFLEDEILVNSHDCNYKFSDYNFGCYVNITGDDREVNIYQDYFGSYGLYMYKNGDYFAVSNSFMYLVNYLSDKKVMTFDDEFAKAFIAPPTAVLAYQDTMIEEITMLPRNCSIKIDKLTKTAEICSYEQKETYIPIDSKEAVDIIDKWHNKWNRIIKTLLDSEEYVSCDLSGGKDSRASLSVLFADKLNLELIRFSSVNDKLSTHNDDFMIASKIALKYGFVLNEKHKKCSEYKMDPTENYYGSLLVKGGFHKELMFLFSDSYNENTHFRITGAVGDLRDFWSESVDTFISNNCSNINVNSVDCGNALRNMMLKSKEQAQKTLGALKHTAKDYFYRNVRMRHQYGKAGAEAFLANIIWLSPLLDPVLYLLSQDIGRDNDYDLLYALIYDRFLPEISDITFDSNRVVDNKTWAIAREINKKYPYRLSSSNDEREYKIVNTRKSPVQSDSQKRPVECLKGLFYSNDVKDFICGYFGEEVYNKADYYYKNTSYHPYIQAACLTQIYMIYKLTANSKKALGLPNSDIPSSKSKEFMAPTQYSNNGFMGEVFDILNSARIDVKNIGGENNEILVASKSDNDLFTEVPNWWADKHGKGRVLQSTKGKLEVKLRCIGNGKLTVKLMGPYMKDNSGNVLSIKTDYTLVTLTNSSNGEVIFSSDNVTYTTDSRHPKIIETECTDGQVFILELNWSPYIYAPGELQCILEKLYYRPISLFKFWKPSC